MSFGAAGIPSIDISALFRAAGARRDRVDARIAAAAAGYHRAIERVAAALMRAPARGLGLRETAFYAAFEGDISTLRLIRYPARDAVGLSPQGAEALYVRHHGEEHLLIGRPIAIPGFSRSWHKMGWAACRPAAAEWAAERLNEILTMPSAE